MTMGGRATPSRHGGATDPGRRATRYLALILALGLALRLAYDVRMSGRPLVMDELSYDSIAWNVASGHGYSTGRNDAERAPTASRGPGFVLLLAGLERIAGHRKLPILLVQALLESLNIWLVWRIGRRAFSDPVLALGGALIYAVYPPFIISAGQVSTETYVSTTILLAIFCGLEWALGGRKGFLPASAVAIGLCALSKPQLAAIAVLIVLAGNPAWRSRRFWLAVATQIAIVTAVLAPWMIRNALVFHAFVPGVTQGGVTFWGGTGPADGRTLGGLGEPGVPPHVLAAVKGLSETQRDRWLYGEGVRVIRSHPGRFALLMLKKLVRLWFNLLHDAPPSRASVVSAVFNFLALILCVIGVRRLHPAAASVRLLAWMFAYFSFVHLFFFAGVRYALPCYAYIFCFTGAAAVSLLPWRGVRPGAPAGAA